MSEMSKRIEGALREMGCGLNYGCDQISETILKAMREPTEAMRKATERVVVGHSWGNTGEHIYEGADDIWRTMIDEALKP